MAQDHREFIRRWFEEVWNKGRASAIDEMMAADAVNHGFGEMQDVSEFKAFHTAYRDAFPNVRIQTDDIVVDGEMVAVRYSGAATHTGNGLGFAATGRPVTFRGMSFVRIKDGKIVEGWNTFDQLGMMQQLGVVPLG